jgi:hypothetical protein
VYWLLKCVLVAEVCIGGRGVYWWLRCVLVAEVCIGG